MSTVKQDVCPVKILLVTLAVVAVPDIGLAHHSFATEFDPDKCVQLRGVITRIAWVNPHVWIFASVPSPDGDTVDWAVEGESPYALFRRGWHKDALLPGMPVVIEGYQAKDGTSKVRGCTVTVRDGRKISIGWCAPPGAVKSTCICFGLRRRSGGVAEETANAKGSVERTMSRGTDGTFTREA